MQGDPRTYWVPGTPLYGVPFNPDNFFWLQRGGSATRLRTLVDWGIAFMDSVDLVDRVDGMDRVNVVDAKAEVRVGGGTGFGNAGKDAGTPKSEAARWRVVSGLTVETEKTLAGAERRGALRKLYKAAEAEIRAELKAAQADEEFKDERTFLWEPIPAVCQWLEIGPTVLSRLLKELTGMSAAQLADKIRAEGIREKLRGKLRERVKRWAKPGTPALGERTFGEKLDEFWSDVKARRRSMSFSYATWAIELGFANYTRFYRACLLCYKKTPSQLEDEVLREFADWFTVAQELKRRSEIRDTPLHRMDRRLDKYRKPYTDGWADAVRTRPEWVERMRAELGLAEEVERVAGE